MVVVWWVMLVVWWVMVVEMMELVVWWVMELVEQMATTIEQMATTIEHSLSARLHLLFVYLYLLFEHRHHLLVTSSPPSAHPQSPPFYAIPLPSLSQSSPLPFPTTSTASLESPTLPLLAPLLKPIFESKPNSTLLSTISRIYTLS